MQGSGQDLDDAVAACRPGAQRDADDPVAAAREDPQHVAAVAWRLDVRRLAACLGLDLDPERRVPGGDVEGELGRVGQAEVEVPARARRDRQGTVGPVCPCGESRRRAGAVGGTHVGRAQVGQEIPRRVARGEAAECEQRERDRDGQAPAGHASLERRGTEQCTPSTGA